RCGVARVDRARIAVVALACRRAAQRHGRGRRGRGRRACRRTSRGGGGRRVRRGGGGGRGGRGRRRRRGGRGRGGGSRGGGGRRVGRGGGGGGGGRAGRSRRPRRGGGGRGRGCRELNGKRQLVRESALGPVARVRRDRKGMPDGRVEPAHVGAHGAIACQGGHSRVAGSAVGSGERSCVDVVADHAWAGARLPLHHRRERHRLRQGRDDPEEAAHPSQVPHPRQQHALGSSSRIGP